MSNPLDARLRAGDLEGAITLATRLVDDAPDDDGTRFCLFELLVMADRFDEARAQIARLGHDETTNDSVALFAGLLTATEARHAFLVEGQGEVAVLSAEPPDWVGEQIGAIQSLARGGAGAAHRAHAALRRWRADPGAPAAVVDGKRVDGFCDADDALAPFVEVVVPDRYLLVPLTDLIRLEFEPVRAFPDRIWRPVTLVTTAQKGQAWIPGCYAGSGAAGGHVALGGVTTFAYPADGLRRGAGQRDFALRKGDDVSVRGIHGISRVEIVRA